MATKTKTKRSKKWERDDVGAGDATPSRMVFFRFPIRLLSRVDAAVARENSRERVKEGREPRVTRTGLVLDSVEATLGRLESGEQLLLGGGRLPFDQVQSKVKK